MALAIEPSPMVMKDRFENQFFDVTGKIKAYESNPKIGDNKNL